MYAEIRQAHIVLLFFHYFADLSFLIILGGLWVPTVFDSQPIEVWGCVRGLWYIISPI